VASAEPPPSETPESVTTSPPEAKKRSRLDVIESIGDKVPHPAIIPMGPGYPASL
jgi:hypothetical protein